MDTPVCMAESLCCSPETITMAVPLYHNYRLYLNTNNFFFLRGTLWESAPGKRVESERQGLDS